MAEPAPILPPEDRPTIRPDLGVIQGGGEGDGVAKGSLREAEEAAVSGASDEGAGTGLKGIKGGGEGDGVPQGRLFRADDGSDASDSSDDAEGGRYKDEGKKKRRVRFNKKVAGGIGGSIIVLGVLFGGSSIVQGPLEVIHFAKFLDKVHFAGQENAQDSRLIRIVRYLKEPGKPENTRLGIVGNKIADSYVKTMGERTGMAPAYDKTTGKFLGYEIDREHPRWKDYKTNQIKDIVSSKFGGTTKDVYVAGNTSDGKQRLIYDPERSINSLKQPVKSYLAQLKTSRVILIESGYSKKSTWVGRRVLSARAGWTFHPIRKLDAAIQDAVLKQGKKGMDSLKEKYRKSRVQEITKGVQAPTQKPSEDSSSKDAKGNPTNPQATQSAQQAASDPNQQFGPDSEQAAQKYAEGEDGNKSLKTKLAAKAGKAVGFAGLLCLGQALNDYVKEAKQAKMIEPMMRMAGDVKTMGSQAQSGDDISLMQLGLFKDFLTEKDDKGRVVSTWNQAESIQAEEGKPNSGKPIDLSATAFNTNNPIPVISGIGPLSTFCKALSSPVGAAIGWLTSPAQTFVQSKTIPVIISAIGGWLSGAPVNPLASGADLGNFANYGAKLSANDQFASVGGVPLSKSEQVAFKSANNQIDQEDFSSKSIATRVFDVNDPRSLSASIIDGAYPEFSSISLSSALNGISSIISGAIKAPSALLFSTQRTQAATTYDYHGAKSIGFSVEDLGNKEYENSNIVACRVVGCHNIKDENGKVINITGVFENQAKADKYTDLAEKCFGVKISNDGTVWNIEYATKSVEMYNEQYPEGDCKSHNSEWMNIRFWILDTATIEGVDCYLGDTDTAQDSCHDMGFPSNTNVGKNDTTLQDTGAALTTEASQLAKDLINSKNVTLQANPKSSLEAAKKGDKSPAGVDECHRQRDPVALDQKLLAFLVDLSKVDQFTITSLTTGTHSCTSNHYEGKAVDFACDVDTSKADNVGQKYGISHNFENCAADQHWHYSIGGK